MSVLSKLSSMFNVLMGITPGYFGRSPRSTEPGPGVIRARDRLAAHRKATAERLKDAPAPELSRQQRRASERLEFKQVSLTPAQNAFVLMKGKAPKYPKTTFVNRF